MKAENVITHINNVEDQIYLKTKAFPVNMRLYHSSSDYRDLIDQCVTLIRKYAVAEYSDYKKPHGMSGANLAIPFNIIGVVVNRGDQKRESVLTMINPVILEAKGEHISKSNCGSIRLEEPIDVKRHDYIRVEYFDWAGHKQLKDFLRYNGGDTIQHEIDHNNGVLITDRAV